MVSKLSFRVIVVSIHQDYRTQIPHESELAPICHVGNQTRDGGVHHSGEKSTHILVIFTLMTTKHVSYQYVSPSVILMSGVLDQLDISTDCNSIVIYGDGDFEHFLEYIIRDPC